jgi:hypothetical protein
MARSTTLWIFSAGAAAWLGFGGGGRSRQAVGSFRPTALPGRPLLCILSLVIGDIVIVRLGFGVDGGNWESGGGSFRLFVRSVPTCASCRHGAVLQGNGQHSLWFEAFKVNFWMVYCLPLGTASSFSSRHEEIILNVTR